MDSCHDLVFLLKSIHSNELINMNPHTALPQDNCTTHSRILVQTLPSFVL